MKQLCLLIAVIGITQFSCRRNDAAAPVATSLQGNWRMILVKDNSTRLSFAKPASIQGDVDITFNTANNSFSGKTPTNDIWQSDFLAHPNLSLTIPFLSMTKVMETSWGNEFVGNICSSQSYTFESGGRLNIKTINRTLTFKKL